MNTISRLLMPYFRMELPGWGLLMRVAKISQKNDAHWTDSADVEIVGKGHGYRMKLELRDWAQRKTYFVGRYYELHVLNLIDAVLKPGDRAVDIGANIGMISLQMSRRVGETGSVECFEPNPECVKRIEWHKTENRLSQLKVYACGLGDKTGNLELKLFGGHNGWATFGHIDAADVRLIPVPVKVGDDVLCADKTPIKLMKIDVEGFEAQVLRGLARTLTRDKPTLIMELIDGQLAHANSSSKKIFEFLGEFGYECYELTVSGVISKRLTLNKVTQQEWTGQCTDVVWIHRERAASTIDALRAAKALVR